jgi:hypothetical protein
MLRLIRAASILLLLGSPASALAASPCGQSVGVTAEQLSGMVDSLRQVEAFADSLVHDQAYVRSRGTLDRSLERIQRLTRPLPRPGLSTVLRWNTSNVGEGFAASALDSDLFVVQTFFGSYVQPYVSEHQDTRLDALLDPLDRLMDGQTRAALASSIDRLRHYQRKFGKGSVPLNWAETALYLGVFQHVPGFGPSAACGPGPWEPVAAYSPVYATIRNKSLVGVSVLELGARRYFFSEKWGTGGVSGLLRPAYASLGAAMASEHDGALENPFKGVERWGGFLAWGDIKLAVVGAHHPKLLVSKQLQYVKTFF